MQNLLRQLKNNIFAVCIVFAYILLFLISPSIGMDSIKNSGYYIKEMLMIMPVVFILTALLDMWVPTEKISQLLGEAAKTKGIILAFVLGSVSAGPIYAAFPMCVMLHKKGASIRNLIIILSSWAVVKIPMLLNEGKFLGFKFMIVRWLLTILAILLFSWLTAKFVKTSDIPIQSQEVAEDAGISINTNACMGCTLCTKVYPELFQMERKKAYVKVLPLDLNEEKLLHTLNTCPVKAISCSDSIFKKVG